MILDGGGMEVFWEKRKEKKTSPTIEAKKIPPPWGGKKNKTKTKNTPQSDPDKSSGEMVISEEKNFTHQWDYHLKVNWCALDSCRDIAIMQ